MRVWAATAFFAVGFFGFPLITWAALGLQPWYLP